MKRIFAVLLLISTTASLHAQKLSKYTLNVGDSYELMSVANQKLAQKFGGQEQVTDQIIKAKERIEVIAFEKGVYTMKSTNLMQAFEMDGVMSQTMHSDSSGLDHLPFSVMKGSSYTYTMKETGEVTAVMGLAELRASMKEELAGTIYAPNADDLTNVYEEATVKSRLNIAFYIYPNGYQEEWTNSYSTQVNDIPLEFNTTLYWDDQDTIFGMAEVVLEGDLETQGMIIQMSLGGDQKTIIDVDSQTGMPIKVQSIQDMAGNMSVAETEIPMTMRTEMTTTISKK